MAGSTLRTDRPGCGVASPYECPAIRLGTTLHFEDPASYESCPALRSRGLSGCSAICVPVSVTGLTVGVIHTLVDGNGANQSSVDSADRIADRVSARVGERIGVIRAFEKSQIQAATDPLTGLLNRRSIEARAVEMMRIGGSLSVMYLDLDHFKRVNDTLGHDAGDRALRRFSKVLRDSTRSSDIVGRWGGEEFLVVSPDDGIATNRLLFDRIREGLLHAAVAGEGPSLTVSAGVATSLTGDTFTSLIGRADSALLQAKQDGRDQLVVSVGANRPSRT